MNTITAPLVSGLRVLRYYLRQLWTRVLIVGVLAVVALGVAQAVEFLIPSHLNGRIQGDAVDRLLQIIANAMLAVTTFSLTVMVTVHRNTSAQFTPRAHLLIMEDTVTQNTLAAFIGTYVFALVAIVLRETGVFTDNQAFVLFWTTVLVMCFVVWSLVRWVLHLQTFGSLLDTSRDVEKITCERFAERLNQPCLGAVPLTGDVPGDAVALKADTSGYVQVIFPETLQDVAEKHGLQVFLSARLGDYVFVNAPLGWVQGDLTEDGAEALRNCIIQGDVRSYDQDPRLGLVAMSEIGSKALSPGINDPGTAVDVISRLGRILWRYTNEAETDCAAQFDRLHVPPLVPEMLLQDAFCAIGRDGAHLIEVHEMMQKVLGGLMAHPDAGLRSAARTLAGQMAELARSQMSQPADIKRLDAACDANPAG